MHSSPTARLARPAARHASTHRGAAPPSSTFLDPLSPWANAAVALNTQGPSQPSWRQFLAPGNRLTVANLWRSARRPRRPCSQSTTARQRYRRASAAPQRFNEYIRVFQDQDTGLPVTMTGHEFTFHLACPEDQRTLWNLEAPCYASLVPPMVGGAIALSFSMHGTEETPLMLPSRHVCALTKVQRDEKRADVLRNKLTTVSPDQLNTTNLAKLPHGLAMPMPRGLMAASERRIGRLRISRNSSIDVPKKTKMLARRHGEWNARVGFHDLRRRTGQHEHRWWLV
ncbi:hypothetical protein K438DRAFT_1762844 [Mycena galopus ATCC 62051]|nr:hypothetical protein K438DRAFT_1762844 [Mycena galopus ATCC 62051]